MPNENYERQSDGTYVRHSPFAKPEDACFWTETKKNQAHKPLWTLVSTLRNKQSHRQMSDDLALQLYSDMDYVGYRSSPSSVSRREIIESRIGTNVIRSIVRTLNSKIARRRSRPFVVTDGASFMQRQTAENLEKWLLGSLRTLRADEDVFPLWRLHALTFGTGCVRVFSDPEDGVQLEVIPPTEIFVDDSEARYGKPPRIYFVRSVSKSVFKHKYPKCKKIIDESSTGTFDKKFRLQAAWDNPHNDDQMTVIEAISLPSGKDADDGRHVITCEQGTLLDEEWTRPHFNCAWMRGELRPAGFWGIGVPEDLASMQLEISETAFARSEIISMLSNPYWLVERGMKVFKSSFSDLVGRVMEWTSTGSGHEPKLVSPNAVPQELWQNEDRLKQSAFETRGVSQLSAQMLKPQGLNSGKALRAYTELESELLADLMNDYESGLLRICHLMLEEQIALAEAYPKTEYSVTHIGGGELETIHWRDVGIKDALKGYVIEILPASALASTLSARIEDVFDLRDLGVLNDPEEVWDYVDMPDRRRLKKKHMSPRRLIEKTIELRIIKRGEDVIPEPTWPLQLAAELTLSAIAELQCYADAPKDRLELLRKFLARIRQTVEEDERKQAEAAAAEALAAQSLPMTPVSGDPNAVDNLAVGPGLDPALAAASPPGLEASAPDLGGGLNAAEAAAAGTAGL